MPARSHLENKPAFRHEFLQWARDHGYTREYGGASGDLEPVMQLPSSLVTTNVRGYSFNRVLLDHFDGISSLHSLLGMPILVESKAGSAEKNTSFYLSHPGAFKAFVLETAREEGWLKADESGKPYIELPCGLGARNAPKTISAIRRAMQRYHSKETGAAGR